MGRSGEESDGGWDVMHDQLCISSTIDIANKMKNKKAFSAKMKADTKMFAATILTITSSIHSL